MSTEPVKSRVALFIDFWNFTLNMKKLDESFLIDWFKIPSAFIQYLQGRRLDGLSDALEYAGCEVVGSYFPHEVSLWNWSRATLQKINGLTSTFLPRQKMEQGPVCTGAEHHEVPSCPQCEKPMLGYKEKGVDSTLVTLMLKKAWLNNYDVALLVSSDRDFIPAISFLQDHNKKCVQAGFCGSGYELAQSCWASINIGDFYADFKRGN